MNAPNIESRGRKALEAYFSEAGAAVRWVKGGRHQLWRPDATSTTCLYLFLDEPLTFLDIHHQIEFMNKIRDFTTSPDVITVGVVHDLNLAARFADHIVLLNRGRIVANGTASEVLTTERIREVFQVETTFVPVEKTGVHLVFD